MITRIAVVAAAGAGILISLACGGTSNIDTSFLAPSGLGGGTTSCPADSVRESDFEDGTRMVLIAIHSDDVYAGSVTQSSMPQAGVVSGDLHVTGDCWYGGGFNADNGTEYYFYKAAFRAE